MGSATPYPSPIPVSGVPGKTTDVKVTLNNFNHTWSGDVAIMLVPPAGTNILLMSAAGSGPPMELRLSTPPSRWPTVSCRFPRRGH